MRGKSVGGSCQEMVACDVRTLETVTGATQPGGGSEEGEDILILVKCYNSVLSCGVSRVREIQMSYIPTQRGLYTGYTVLEVHIHVIVKFHQCRV